MKQHTCILWLMMALLALGLNVPVQAQDERYDVGIQLNGLGGSGKPTNDILGFGIHARFGLNERWWLRVGIDHSDVYDIEGPADFFGLPADFSAGVVDAEGTSTKLMGWVERVYGREGRLEWFWAGGVGYNLNDIDPVTGPLIGGGSYRIITNDTDEVIGSVLGGLRWFLGTKWRIELIVRGDQHFADWKLVDEISGATATIDDYFIRGVTLGLRKRF